MAGICKNFYLKNPFRSISFLLVFCVLVLLIPVNCWNIYSAQQSQAVIINQTRSSIDNLGTIYMKNLEHRIKMVNNYCYDMASTSGGLFLLADIKERGAFLTSAGYLANETREHIGNYEDADAFFIYSPEFDLSFVRTMSTLTTYMRPLQDYFSDEDNLVRKNLWSIVEIAGSRWLVHINHWYGIYFGGCINLDKITEEIRTDLSYPSLEVTLSPAQDADVGTDCISITNRCGRQNLYLHITVSNSDVVENLPLLHKHSLTIAIISLFAAPLLLLFLQYLVVRPLRKVVRALNLLKQDPDMRISGHSLTREFDEVYHSFNGMAGEIVELKIDNYEKQLDKQKLEISNMRLQMNPHFLMNTFNLIFHLAQMKEFEKIQMMVLYLSDYFRYINGQKQDFTTVDSELELIHKYLEVAQIQYMYRFETEFDIAQDIGECQIPTLLLHNFVENFMKHGIELKRLNHLKIKGWRSGEMLEFVIIDDGRGMPREQAQRINEGIFEYGDKKTHIGLQNAYRRLDYLYKGRAVMHVEADTGLGVTVSVRLPYRPDDGEGVIKK